ncbi:hypothetical protein Tco_0040472 [Tanacetum coccineum]
MICVSASPEGLTRRIVISSIRSVDKFDDVEGMHLEVVVFDPHASDSGCKLVRRGGAEVGSPTLLCCELNIGDVLLFPSSRPRLIPVPPLVIEVLRYRLGTLEYEHRQLVKKVIHVSDAEVAAGLDLRQGMIWPQDFSIEGKVRVILVDSAGDAGAELLVCEVRPGSVRLQPAGDREVVWWIRRFSSLQTTGYSEKKHDHVRAH